MALPSDCGQRDDELLGLEWLIFALLIGLFISNVIGVPGWLRETVKTEYYIKTGLVILGAGILFFEILQTGALGSVQALLVVTVIWYICFWFSRRWRVDRVRSDAFRRRCLYAAFPLRLPPAGPFRVIRKSSPM